MSLPIPVIETYGTAYEVGQQIGQAARAALTAMHAEARTEYGESWSQLLEQAIPFREATGRRLPRVLEEIRGCAAGAQLPYEDLFLMSVEELFCGEVPRPNPAETPPPDRGIQLDKTKGCSDLAAAPPATADGHVWLAHNNDLAPDARDQLFVTRFRVIGEPEIVGVTVGGLFISIGLNDAGVALTGNQVNANDSRVGVPRLLIVRDLLAQSDLDAALESALMPERASSYNNIIASRDGRVVNAEGSATAAAIEWSSERAGTLAHTNHYLAPQMLCFEADPNHVAMSAARCARAFDYADKYRGRIDFDICQRFVRDHVYAPWSVCKHAGQSVTVFSAIIDLTDARLWLTSGNPCSSEFSECPTSQSLASSTPAYSHAV
jgi:isopenicillin-N N-acyltransferase-like protein